MLLLAQIEAPVEVEVEQQVQRMSNLGYLLQAGGLPFLAMGLVLVLAGLILLMKRRQRVSVAIYACCLLLPGVVALVAVYTACSEFVELASSPDVPRPAELFGVLGRAMGRCFFGLLATLVPMLLAIIAFLRVRSPEHDQSSLSQDQVETG